jgi:hypothetical protein
MGFASNAEAAHEQTACHINSAELLSSCFVHSEGVRKRPSGWNGCRQIDREATLGAEIDG